MQLPKVVIRQRKYVAVYFHRQFYKVQGLVVNCTSKIDEDKLLKNNQLTNHFKDTKTLSRIDANILISKTLKYYTDLVTEAYSRNIDPTDYIKQQDLTRIISHNSGEITPNTSLDNVYSAWLDKKIEPQRDFKANSTIEGYYKVFPTLKKYCIENPTSVKHFNIDFINNFIRFMSATGKDNSTMIQYCKKIITCLKDFQKTNDFKIDFDEILKLLNDLPTKSDNVENVIALSDSEVQALIDYTSNFKQEMKCRDLFLFCCETGLRFGDAVRLDESHIQNNTIIMYTQKTNELITVPMSRLALEIFEKYDRNFSDKFNRNNPMMNLKLHTLLKKIPEFNYEKKKMIYRGKNNVDNFKMVKYYTLVTFHKSRATFITNLIENNDNINASDIRRITGWSDVSMILNYLEKSRQAKNKTLKIGRG